MKNRLTVKFCGESGQGINTLGKIFSHALNKLGYRIFAYREYPSLIQGGYASYKIDFSNKAINSTTRNSNILAILDTDSFNEYWNTVSDNGLVIYTDKTITLNQEQEEFFKAKNIQYVFLDVKTITEANQGTEIMHNIVTSAFIWRCLELPIKNLQDIVYDLFREKEIDLETEMKCLLAGYNSSTYRDEYSYKKDIPPLGIIKSSGKILSGNDALALGAISAGVRAYYAYPMTPATSIFKYLGSTYKETGILIKQAENEITAVQMALGSMYMGTRALTSTSGGGYDLMTETISCAGISETPLVVILAQRTGAGTGLPTWTGAGDISVATKGGHGEFPRCVISVSDIESAYIQIQNAFNIAEQYQIPVTVLTEKQIAESLFNIKDLPSPVKIERNLSTEGPRYKITENGISPRWIPNKDLPPYLNTSDEHDENSISTENSLKAIEMTDKRFRKMETLLHNLPEPVLYGNSNASNILVGYGNTKNVCIDVLNEDKDIAYLHYEYLFPLKTEMITNLIAKGKNLILVENNKGGEFGSLISEYTGYVFKDRLLKYDGRPFFVEDILDFLNNNGY